MARLWYENGSICSHGAEEGDITIFGAAYIVNRVPPTRDTLDTLLFHPHSFTADAVDHIVINDAAGVLADAVANGTVMSGSAPSAISTGKSHPALGGLTVLRRTPMGRSSSPSSTATTSA